MKLLIIEDNRDIAENIADYLEPQGHLLDFAADGQQGLALALAHEFDVIVLDLTLPRMDGFSVCRRLREAGCETPVLMLTARDQLDDKLAGFGAGADDYLVKPFSVKELEVRLHALLKRLHQFGDSRVLQLADLSFDPDTLQARRAGLLLELNPVQRKLLALLLRQSPRVVTREQLEQAVWGDMPPDNDVLRTHIYGLRAVMDKPFAQKLLHTVRGAGYRLATTDTDVED